jgi:hypothetical protein
MTTVPAIHLAIIQPAGYVHSLGFLDQARYFRHMFRRLGATVTLAKNRLREDAVNFVFGAHLGFPAEWEQRHACVFVNLEQLGDGVDYDAANVAAYAQDPDDVPIFSFGYASYLDQPASALEDRPIDLLFFGSVNARRQQFIARVESAGFNVATFDAAIYGPERDEFIRRAKAVLNCHYYESNRFEQARAFHCLSLGTPLISEYTPTTDPAPAFVDSVLWLPEQVEEWFSLHFGTPAFYEESRKRLAAFRTPDAAHDPVAQFADLLDFAGGFQQGFARLHPPSAWAPRAINLDAATQYKPGWLNIDARAACQPDLVLDLAQPLALPCELPTQGAGSVRLDPGALDIVYAGETLARAADLPVARSEAVAWSDYTEHFWRAGWFEARFEMAPAQWLDDAHDPVDRAAATRVRLVLRKAVTTPRERTLARTLQADFGGIADDAVATTSAPSPHAPSAAAALAAVAAALGRPGASTRAAAPVPVPVPADAPARAQAEPAATVTRLRPHPAGLPASLVALLLDR